MRAGRLQQANDIADHGIGEVIVNLADGWSLRSDGQEFQAGDYVRLCRPDGTEYLYWSSDEWRDDPELVMGAIIMAAAGRRPNDTMVRLSTIDNVDLSEDEQNLLKKGKKKLSEHFAQMAGRYECAASTTFGPKGVVSVTFRGSGLDLHRLHAEYMGDDSEADTLDRLTVAAD